MTKEVRILTKLLHMMQLQRDGFRTPKGQTGALGSGHSDEVRQRLADLLDWYLVSVEQNLIDWHGPEPKEFQ